MCGKMEVEDGIERLSLPAPGGEVDEKNMRIVTPNPETPIQLHLRSD